MVASRQGASSWHHRLNTVVTAMVFIVVGFLFFGRNLGIIDPYWFDILVSWQMLLVVVGLTNLVKRNYWGGLTVMAVGVFFLLRENACCDYISFNIFWPFILILIGLSILFKRKPVHFYGGTGQARNREYAQETYASENGFVVSDSTFGSVQQIVLDPVFKGGRLKCTFGSSILDLRRTKLEEAETYIDVECTFGGIAIYLPGEWNVQTQVQTIIGECDDKRFNQAIRIDTGHTLVIRGKVTFGGIELKS